MDGLFSSLYFFVYSKCFMRLDYFHDQEKLLEKYLQFKYLSIAYFVKYIFLFPHPIFNLSKVRCPSFCILCTLTIPSITKFLPYFMIIALRILRIRIISYIFQYLQCLAKFLTQSRYLTNVDKSLFSTLYFTLSIYP